MFYKENKRNTDYHKLKMLVTGNEKSMYEIQITKKRKSTNIYFDISEKTIHIPETNDLAFFLEKRRPQLKRIFNNKREETFYKGFKIHFVLKDENGAKENPFSKDKIAIIDHRGKYRQVQWAYHGISNICKIFTDGSYNEHLDEGAYTLIIKKSNGFSDIFTFKSNNKGSNLIELEAIIKALKMTKNQEKINITTDSRYVIKGITEWIPIWKLNNWITANGEKVKNKMHWKKLNQLVKGRYVEFKWVKSHSHCSENNLCDYLSRKHIYQSV